MKPFLQKHRYFSAHTISRDICKIEKTTQTLRNLTVDLEIQICVVISEYINFIRIISIEGKSRENEVA